MKKLLGFTAIAIALTTPAIAGENHKNHSHKHGHHHAHKVKYSANHNSAFDKLDTNKDGLIAMNEFENVTMHDNEPAVFKMYDLDDDGYITRAELRNNDKQGYQTVNRYGTTSNLKSSSGQSIGGMDAKYYSQNRVNRDIDRSLEIFAEIDTDNNGELTQDEFMAGTMHNNEAEVFAMLDKNQSNSLSQNEFRYGSKIWANK